MNKCDNFTEDENISKSLELINSLNKWNSLSIDWIKYKFLKIFTLWYSTWIDRTPVKWYFFLNMLNHSELVMMMPEILVKMKEWKFKILKEYKKFKISEKVNHIL